MNAIYAGAFCALYVVTWLPVAWATEVLLPGQMVRKYPTPGRVIPLVLDFYVWADLFILSPLIAYVFQEIGDQWRLGSTLALGCIGIIAGILFQRIIIIPGRYPSTLGGAGRTTLIGYLHIPFFALAVAVLLKFLFSSVSVHAVLVVMGALALMVPINMLVPLHFARKWLQLEWAPDVFDEETRLFWMIGGSWVTLVAVGLTKIYWT